MVAAAPLRVPNRSFPLYASCDSFSLTQRSEREHGVLRLDNPEFARVGLVTDMVCALLSRCMFLRLLLTHIVFPEFLKVHARPAIAAGSFGLSLGLSFSTFNGIDRTRCLSNNEPASLGRVGSGVCVAQGAVAA